MPKRGQLVYHRKDGLWEARYIKSIDIDGKKKYGSVYAHTCKEVKEKRENVSCKINISSPLPTPQNISLIQLANEYLLVLKSRIKDSSYQRYESIIKNHITDIGALSVNALTTSTIHSFALDKLASGLLPGTVNSILTFLHSCIKYGKRQYNIQMHDILYIPTPKKEMRVLSRREQNILTEYLRSDIDIYKFGVLLSLYTGLRIGELCGLKWEDFDDEFIKINRTIQRLKNPLTKKSELHIGPPKTETSSRIIPIPSFLKTDIEYFKSNSSEEYFLGTSTIHIAEPRIMQLRFKKYLKEAGVDDANFHSLRHTFATRCVECDFEIKTLSEILGHSNVQITLNKYVHSSFQLKKDNMEKLVQIL